MLYRLMLMALIGVAGFCVAPAALAQTGDVIGRIQHLQGAAQATRAGAIHQLIAGSPVHAGAAIATGPAARLRIIFRDNSQLILGAEARIVLDALVFDGEHGEGGAFRQAFDALQGAFRFVTGEIGREDPGAVRIRTPVATIGIRGTDFFGGPISAGAPDGRQRYGFLLLGGAITVESPDGRVTLDEVNEGTFLPLAGGAPPTEPQIWSRDALDEALAAVRID